MNEKSWASTYVDYNGFKVTATEMGDTAEKALTSLMDMLDAVDAKPWVDRNNVYTKEDLIGQADEIPFGEPIEVVSNFQGPLQAPVKLVPVGESLASEPTPDELQASVTEDPFADPTNPTLYGVVEFPPKAPEVNPGDEWELLVDQYELKEGALSFYKKDSEYEYSYHTHYLNDFGVKKMTEVFGASWDKAFKETTGIVDIPGGDLVIRVVGSDTRRTKGSGKGNVFRNLEGQRRP